MRQARGILLAAVALGCAAGESESTAEGGCEVSGWPEGEAALYVAASCPAEGADGSRKRPFNTLGAALAVAAEGATVAVAPGTYAEALALDRPVRLVGAVDASRGIILKVPAPDAAGIILQVPAPDALGIILKSPAPDTAAVTVKAAGVELVGLRIEGAHRAGVEVLSGSATVTDCRVEGTAAVGGAFGSAAVARAGAQLTVRRSALLGSAGAGVYFEGASGAVEGSLLEGNAAGGFVVVGGEVGIILQDSELVANVGAGVSVYGGRGIILKRTAITGTVESPEGVAYGVVATEKGGVGASLRLEDGVTVAGSAGVGVLVDGASSAVLEDAVVTGNDGGGIWLQKGAGAGDAEGVKVSGCSVADNGLVGVAATLGASLHLVDSSVLGTSERTAFDGLAQIEVADGVILVAGAKARVESNAIEGNARLGVLADGVAAADVNVSGNSLTKHPVAIILQHPKGGSALVVGHNTYSENSQDVVTASDAEAVGVPKALSDGLTP